MMHFSGGINCPPYETADGFLQVTEGCSHNRCLFCTYFKNVPYRVCGMDEIEADIRQIPYTFGAPKRVFLQGADGWSADYGTLMRTAELIREQVPSVQTIGGYARVDSFADKTVEQLCTMKDAGYSDPYVGVESGRDETLHAIGKGYGLSFAREQLAKLDASGMKYTVNYLCGAAGCGHGLENARATAELYNGLHPTMVNMSMLTVVPGTPLFRAAEKGLFVEETEIEKLEEAAELLRCLDIETVFMNEHASNSFHIVAKLPEQRNDALDHVRSLIRGSDEEQLENYRRAVVRAF